LQLRRARARGADQLVEEDVVALHDLALGAGKRARDLALDDDRAADLVAGGLGGGGDGKASEKRCREGGGGAETMHIGLPTFEAPRPRRGTRRRWEGRSSGARSVSRRTSARAGFTTVFEKPFSPPEFVYTVKVEPKTVNAGRNGKGMRELVGEGGVRFWQWLRTRSLSSSASCSRSAARSGSCCTRQLIHLASRRPAAVS
jgi:hypothetical protein